MNRMLLGVVVLSLLLAGCATGSHFGVPDRATRVPQWVLDGEADIAKAEGSAGARICPEKIAKAKELAAKAMETYWACRDFEAPSIYTFTPLTNARCSGSFCIFNFRNS